VWDWSFAADPIRAREFVNIRHASRAGITLIGSGTETVTTAPYFHPNQIVHLSNGQLIRADRTGRLSLGVNLGPAHTLQQYTAAADLAEATTGGYWKSVAITFDT